jgi:hypothetical protein
MLVEAIALGTVVAVAGAVIGAFIACALAGRRELVLPPRAWGAAAAGLAAVGAVLVYLGHTTTPPARVMVSLDETGGPGSREAVATVRFDAPDAARDPDWLYTVAWQGGERVRTAPLVEIAPDVYRTEPLPLSGTWKSTIRLQSGDRMGRSPSTPRPTRRFLRPRSRPRPNLRGRWATTACCYSASERTAYRTGACSPSAWASQPACSRC